MSAAPLRQTRASARPRPAARPVTERPQLRPVRAPEPSRTLMPFMWLCVGIVVAALAVVLLINTTMAEGAYERRDLKIEIANLHQEAETVRTQLEANASPANLAARAAALGMAPAEVTGTMSLSKSIVTDFGEK